MIYCDNCQHWHGNSKSNCANFKMTPVLDGLTRALRDVTASKAPEVKHVTDGDFPFDYIVEYHGSITVLDPVSVPALRWMYQHLPDDCPRWGKFGFAVETRYIPAILEGLRQDGLFSESEYQSNMGGEA